MCEYYMSEISMHESMYSCECMCTCVCMCLHEYVLGMYMFLRICACMFDL